MTTMQERKLHATLTCTSGKYAGKTFHVVNNATIGRNGDNSILLDAMVVSNRHARIFFDKAMDCYMIEDLGSRTGIMVDTEFVDDRAPLRDGQTVTIANEFRFVFHIDDSDAERSEAERSDVPEDSAAGEPQADPVQATPVLDDPPADPAPVPGETADVPASATGATQADAISSVPEGQSTATYYLEQRGAAPEMVTYTLSEGINLVGRDPSNTIHLQDASVSRHHAVIVLKNGKMLVRDLDSKNHTFVDGLYVEHEREMKTGSIVLFGLVGLVVRERT